MEIKVNGKASKAAPVTLVVAPLEAIPNLPPHFIEQSRWTDGTGTTVIRCWPEDLTATRMVRS